MQMCDQYECKGKDTIYKRHFRHGYDTEFNELRAYLSRASLPLFAVKKLDA
jgi:hypothetical protein